MIVVVKGLVVVLAQDLQAFISHLAGLAPGMGMAGEQMAIYLSVEVPVPGKDFGVPVPGQQGTVGDPSLDSQVLKSEEISADEMSEGVLSFFIGDDFLKVSNVIVV